MGKDEVCHVCGGDGYVLDYSTTCGDPDCCGYPLKLKCRNCDNDWVDVDNN